VKPNYKLLIGILLIFMSLTAITGTLYLFTKMVTCDLLAMVIKTDILFWIITIGVGSVLINFMLSIYLFNYILKDRE